ncbi:MAG: hypothetical protein KAR18_02675, partial [Spirochaetes bacterium]|nr:hypothetical protein [Spirochaetota bacterium]
MITSAKISSFSRQQIFLHDIIVELTTHIPPKHKHLGNPSKRPMVVLLVITASIPAEVEVRPEKM